MCLHYKTPILLIEFDEGKSFSLQNLSDMKDTIVATDLSSKLVLLTLTFPKVKLIWSSSPHETAAVFKELKVERRNMGDRQIWIHRVSNGYFLEKRG